MKTTLLRLVRGLWRRSYVRWRRSIQVRVVTTTLLLSTIVAVVLGVFLMQQITTALLESRGESAVQQLNEGLGILKRTPGDPVAERVARELAARSGPSGRYEVYLRDTREVTNGGLPTNDLDPASIPAQLTEEINREPGAKVWIGKLVRQYHEDEAALIAGARDGPYELYYLFPLQQEQRTLVFVQRTMVGVGVALVLLLAAIASVVTRQIVIPVRLAAQSAERLAAGQLDERMKVRGEDDLARLGRSFNDMATTLQEKISELEGLSQVQRQFVSDVSHELRTPLTTMKIAADMLYENREDFQAMVARSAELLQSQMERFESLLADLLEISRHDAGAATLDAESVDVRELVLTAVDDVQDVAERRGTKIVLKLPGEACMAEVDRRRIARVLRNLLFNAVEHGEGKDIVVTVAADRDAVALAVRDHGTGLKAGEAQMVFDRFWRADPSRARTIGGTGLGLSISREDAQLHGGWLQAWGEPGVGSQFRLSLPRTAGAELRGSPLPLVPADVELNRADLADLADLEGAE
ncbi:MtrAB system histidine kinase MtrB [Actinocorallia populi]|uniref:MtrAB system histidine kinase MtrB n=1 Tax=Actinocorallia populi TaxID=2079200 RepID=UPI000D08AE18|nr:MtrAB system histidine kinase MtrB [Actinocorallia populi]